MNTHNGRNKTEEPAQKLAAEAGQMAGNFAGQIATQAESVYQVAKENLAETGQQLAKGYDTAKKEIKHAGTQFEGQVKKHPFLAVAAAAGTGWLLGKFFRSRK